MTKKKTNKKPVSNPKKDPPTKTPQRLQSVQSSRCPVCDSTERTPYRLSRPPLLLDGMTPEGKPFSHVIWRSTKCRSCGQLRVDKEFMYNPKQSDLEEAAPAQTKAAQTKAAQDQDFEESQKKDRIKP